MNRETAFQPRDSNPGKKKTGDKRKRNRAKNLSMEAQGAASGQNVQKSRAGMKDAGADLKKDKSTFSGQDSPVKPGQADISGQNVQKPKQRKSFRQDARKSGTEPGREIKSGFEKESSVFSGQDSPIQMKKPDKGQPSKDGYHRRDTYRQSGKKEKYQRKRVQRERQNRERTKDSGFKEDSGTPFKESANPEFTDGELKGSKKLEKKQKQAQKAGAKVQKAKAKLPKKREYTLQRVFDEETGRGKYVVVPVDREKPFKPESIPKSAMHRLQGESRNFIHGKVAEAEKENSAVEGAHKTEQKGEELFGFVKRHYKGREQRQRAKAAKLEQKHFQKEVNFQYQKFLEENPQMQKKALQKRIQKQRIKREYLKARKKNTATKTAQEAAAKTTNTVTAIAKKLQEIAGKHIGVVATVGIIAVLLVMVMTAVSSCGAMFADTQSTILASSYLSEPAEIDAADMQLTRLELDLQNRIDRIESDYPDYDEYTYNLGEIGHNPFTLIGYLSAIHTEFTASGVEGEVQALFNEMYTLELTPDTETRTRTVETTDGEGNTVTEEEEYEVSILRVSLTARPLETIAAGKMDTGQKEIYAMYSQTGGLLQEFASPLDLYWYNYISSYYGYRENPATGNEELHRGLDIAVPTGTTVYAAHDGTVTEAAYDSHYGNYVVIEKDGYTTKYAHMESLNISAGQAVEKGTVIGTTGSTGSSTGSSLHIECLYNGEYYNPLFYFNVGTETLYGEGTGGATGNVIPPDSYDDAQVQALMEEAAKYLGYPYVWGGSSPSTSFDCSGFVCWVYSNSGVHSLPRTTAQGIYNQCIPVSASEAKAGDIIFFTGTYNSAGPVSHVGIYCGDGVMIHCGDPIGYASVNSSYWQSHFYGFGRLN